MSRIAIGDRVTILVLLGVGLIVGLSYLDARKPTRPNVAKINDTGDSLTMVRDKLDSALITSDLERQASSDAQRASAQREARSRVRAEAAKRRADSLAVLAAASDSTSAVWRAAYEERTTEAGELTLQLSEAHARIDSLAADTLRLTRDLLATVTYAQGLERFNADVRRELVRARECRIVGRVPCPSRLQTAVTVLIVDRAAQLVAK